MAKSKFSEKPTGRKATPLSKAMDRAAQRPTAPKALASEAFTEEITADEAARRFGTSREKFTALATSEKPSRFRESAARVQAQWAEHDAARAEFKAGAPAREFEADTKALVEGRAEDVRNWQQIAQAVIRMNEADDPKARETVNAMLWSYGDELRPHIDAEDTGWWEQNYSDPQEPDRPWWQDGLRMAEPVLGYLDQWGQSAMSAIAGIEAAVDTKDQVSASEGITHAIRQGARAIDVTRAVPRFGGISQYLENVEDPGVITKEDGTRLSFDRDQSGSINLREALGKDPESGGKTLTAIDLIGSIAMDPSTYVTLGGSGLARVGMKATEEAAERLGREGLEGMSRAYAREMNQRIMREGFKSLEKGEQALYKSLLRTANEMAAEAGGRTTTRFGRDLVEAQFKAIERGGQSGLRIAGTTTIPTAGLGDIGRSAGLLADQRYGRIVKGGGEGAGEVAAKLDEIIDGVPQSTWGSKVDELDDVARASLDQVRELGRTSGLGARIFEHPRVAAILGAMKPRAKIQARWGADVADELGQLLSVTRDPAGLSDLPTRLGTDMHKNGLMQKSLGEFDDMESWTAVLDNALSSSEGFDEALSSVGGETRKLLEALDGLRTETFAATLRGKGYSADEIAKMADGTMDLPSDMHDINTYVTRTLSAAAKHDADLMTQVRNLAGKAGVTNISPTGGNIDEVAEGFSKKRMIGADGEPIDSLVEANKQMAGILRQAGVEFSGDFFETNIPVAMALRQESALNAASKVDLLEGLTKITDDKGMALAFWAKADEAAELTAEEAGWKQIREAGGKVGDYAPVKLDNGAIVYVHREVADELKSLNRVFETDIKSGELARWFDQMNNIWAMSATVGLVNPGFHIRNSVGNAFNAFLGGTRDPRVFGEAAKLQRTFREAQQVMRETGANFEDALRTLNLPAKDATILRDARKLGVLGDSRTLDLTRVKAGRTALRRADSNVATGSGGAQLVPANRFRAALNPADPTSQINKHGVAIGTSIEGNARLGVYIDQLNKGASPQAAAAHVKRYLFDYGDLTRLESTALRRASRFYTFTRKNTAVQAYALAHYPARISNAEAVSRALLELASDPFDPEAPGGEGGAPEWMRNPLLRRLGGTNVALSVDTPFASAAELAELGPAMAAMFSGTGPLSTVEGREEFMGRTDSLFSGVGVSALNWMEETRTGRDSFTGRELNGDLRDNWIFRGVETLFPAAARGERYLAQAGVTRGGEAERELQVLLANALLGIQTTPLNEDTDASARYVLWATVNETMDELRESGIDVPTLDEMRERGDLATRDRVVQALLYSWEQDPETGEYRWSDTVRDDRLLNVIPKDMRQALKLPEPTSGAGSSKGARPELDDDDLSLAGFDLQQAIKAIEAFRGAPLTDDERRTVVLASPWAPNNSLLEGMGIEPERDSNRFIKGEEELPYEQQLAQAEDELRQLAAAAGLDSSSFAQFRPRLPEFQRILNEAAEAGVSEAELHDYVLLAKDEGGGGVLSRNDKAAMNQLLGYGPMDGPVPISSTRYKDLTDDDIRKIQDKAWEADQEYLLFSKMYGLPVPTQEQRQQYVVAAVMTSGEAKAVGLRKLRGASNRKDQRSPGVFAQDSRSILDSSMRGITQGPSRP